jgi:GntR family transcriptional regulator
MPLWAQLLEILRERLDRGEFADTFPTDAELTEQYGLSRHTVREAVRRLQEKGVVSRERGRGTFVRSSAIEQPTGAIYSLFRSIESQGREQRSTVLSLEATTDAEVAGRLGLSPTSRLVRLERVRYADGQPLAHDTAWLPADIAAPLLEVDFTRTALYDELSQRCGVRPTSGSEWIHTALPGPEDRELLGLRARQPVFTIERLSHFGERAIEWRETVVRGDGYTFVAHWSGAGDYNAVLTSRPTSLPADPIHEPKTSGHPVI